MRSAGWRAIAVLPANVLGTLPATLLWLTRDAPGWSWRLAGPGDLVFWLALPCFALGGALMAATIRRFDVEGEGTLAPWDPTRRLVVSGPYRHVRNPMISGVLANLLGEALLLRSPAIALWLGAFFLANALYIPLVEEPGLAARFGDDYARYRRAVPRWIPRIRPWDAGA